VIVKICEKRQSILDAGGHCLVMGGPGSGKTTLALLKALARIDAGLRPSQEVLFLSFSRAAVARIRDAVRGQIRFDKAGALAVQTFHSFFWQILRSHGYLLGAPRQLSVILAHDEKAMCNGIERDHADWKAWEEQRLALFQEKGQVCFDLFAPLTAQLLRHAKRLRSRVSCRYPLILVDEAQDTSGDQWECVKLLAEKSQVICLADPNQMIYDFIPGVGPQRIVDIKGTLNPLEVDFASENNRSPSTEIAAFGRDILHGAVRGSPYKGVSRIRFRSKAEDRDRSIRRSIGILSNRISAETGVPPESMAVIAAYGHGVAVVSSALQTDPPISHQVLFDEAFALLSSRVAAFLMEPKVSAQRFADVAVLLELIGAAFRAKGNKGALEQYAKCEKYAKECRTRLIPNVKIARAADLLVQRATARALTGDPRQDWTTVKQEVRLADDAAFKQIAGSLDYLVAFGRGRLICENLSAMWMAHGAYVKAREALHSALTQEQILSAGEQLRGIHVMNMHKCKGKQFDGVVLYRQQHTSPFVWHGDVPPYPKSRKLLHVAITRAKSRVLILDEAMSRCPIIGPHVL
jgi:DNA helicase-2/ATP-dependent DNA helicase PcrA